MSEVEDGAPAEAERLATAEQFGRHLAGRVRGAGKTQYSLSFAVDRLIRQYPESGLRPLRKQRISEMENLGRHSLPTDDELRAYVYGCGKPERYNALLQALRRIRRDRAQPVPPEPPAVAATTETPIAALPRPAGSFTGRAAELDELSSSLGKGKVPDVGGGAHVRTVDGMGGVGKTAFAVYAAHKLAARFPDGQIFLQLHGHTPGVAPLEPHQALAQLLMITGLDPRAILDEPQARLAQWRSRAGGRRLLLVLDDAADADQVRPLIPAEPAALVLVTSRRRLADLEDADPISLDVLPPQEAATLFARVSGRALDPADPDVARVAALCGYLPLSLDLAAGLLKHHRPWTCADVADRLAASTDRSAELRVGLRSAAAAFDLSYRDLTPKQQRLLRQLSLHPGPDLDPYAAAALGDLDEPTARRLLEDLEENHLIQEPERARYRMHDLVREHARAQPAAAADLDSDPDTNPHPDPDPDRTTLTRLFDHYLHTTARAGDLLYAFDAPLRPRISAAHTPGPPLPDEAAARAWLSAEQANLVAIAPHLATGGWPEYAVQLSGLLWRHLEVIGHYHDGMSVHSQALDAARGLGDRQGESRALNQIGSVYWQLGRYPEAVDHHKQALSLAQEAGDRIGEGRVLDNLGAVCWQLGNLLEAVDYFEQSLAIRRETASRAAVGTTLNNLAVTYIRLGRHGDADACWMQALDIHREERNRLVEGVTLGNLAFLYARTGRYQESIDYSLRALKIHEESGNRPTEPYALANLALVYQRTGRIDESELHYRKALDLVCDFGDRPAEAQIRSALGALYASTGRYQEAVDYLVDGVTLSREIGDQGVLAEALNHRAGALCDQGDHAAAETDYREALEVSRETGDVYETARALDGLAHTRHAAGAKDEAQALWREALDLYTAMEVPEADDVRARLAD